MSADYRVLALDQRGHGESQWAAADAYGTMEMVEDLATFVAAMGLEIFALLGLSMVGIVAFCYAGRHQAQLAKLVIVDIAPEIDAQGLKNIQSNVARSDVFNTRSEAFSRARADNPRPPADHHRYRVDYSLMRTEDGRWTYCYDRALRDPGNRRESVPAEAGWQMGAFRTFL